SRRTARSSVISRPAGATEVSQLGCGWSHQHGGLFEKAGVLHQCGTRKRTGELSRGGLRKSFLNLGRWHARPDAERLQPLEGTQGEGVVFRDARKRIRW